MELFNWLSWNYKWYYINLQKMKTQIRFIRYILFIGIFFCLSTVNAQTPIKKSKNKIVVGGKTYLLHIVEPKQTLYSICKAYQVNMAEIMTINNKTTTSLNVNDALRIPIKNVIKPVIQKPEYSGEYIFHTVEKGNTLFALHKKYGVDIADIIKLNPATEKGLSIGTVIRIPKIKEEKQEPVLPQPHFDDDYYYYIVQKGDTRYAIAQKFNIRYRKLRRYNRFLKKRKIQLGDEIRIPLKYVSEQYLANLEDAKLSKKRDLKKKKEEQIKQPEFVASTEKTEEAEEKTVVPAPVINKENIQVALMLPLYLQKNDTINKIVTVEDSVTIVTERDPRIIYRKTKNFLRFYQGVLAAIDTLNQYGYQVEVSLFDTQNDPQLVRNTLTQMQYTPFDFILGPIYPKTFSAVSKFASIHQIPIISPLSVANMGIKNNPYSIQLNPSVEYVGNNIADYVTSKIDSANVVVLHPSDYISAEEYSLVKTIEQQLFEQGKYWKTSKLNYHKLNYDSYQLNALSRILRDDCENIIVIPSNNQPLVEHYITELNILKKRFNIRVVGYPRWQRFSSLEPDLYYDLNLTLVSPYYIDYNNRNVTSFVTNFRNKFGCEPTDFSFRGYDAMLFFSQLAKQYGKALISQIKMQPSYQLLQSSYQFKKVSDNGGYENTGFYIIHYNKNYTIEYQKR